MNTEFPRMLTLMRKEHNISQKQAAAELGVSQALLSHYERGIRECGLDFVVKVSDYYGVSCDYLLGRTADRSGAYIQMDDIPDNPAMTSDKRLTKVGMAPILTKKFIINSINILYDMIIKTGSKQLAGEVSTYLVLAVYRMFRVLFATDAKNPKDFFAIPEGLYKSYCDGVMGIAENNATVIATRAYKELPLMGEVEEISPVAVNTESLSENYHALASSLLNLVKEAEQNTLKGCVPFINSKSKDK